MTVLDDSEAELEKAKLELELVRHRADILKWIIVAIGAVISFAVIDYGNLQLERFRVTAENQRELLNAYLKATESPEPDVWKRKLNLIVNLSSDTQTQNWAQKEFEYIENFAALDALYRETLKVASQLVEPTRINSPERIQARIRYNQLYWADLPYAGESTSVVTKMVAFRNQLIEAEKHPESKERWDVLNIQLIELSKALQASTPKYTLNRNKD